MHVRRAATGSSRRRVKLVFRHRRLPLAHRDGVRPQRADDGRHVPRDVRPLPLLDLGPAACPSRDRRPSVGSPVRRFRPVRAWPSRRVSHRFRGVVGARVVLGVQSGEIGGGRRRRVGLLERRDEGHEPRQREEQRAEENLLGRSLAVTSRSLRTCTTTNFTHALSASASISISADVSVLISAATSADAERDSASMGTSGGRSGAPATESSACVATCDLQLLRSCRSAARTCGSARRR